MIEVFVELYRAYLKRKALEYGMSPLLAEAINIMAFPDEFETLIEFLVDEYSADRKILTGFMQGVTPDLYLADSEEYNEWEMP